MVKTQAKPSFFSTYWRWLATVALLALAAVVLARNAATLRAGFRALANASPGGVALALVLTGATFCIAAATYGVLALKPLIYRQTVLIELSAAAVNRLLPSGLGGLGIHGLYLYRKKHTPAQATVVVSVNNLLGMAAHFVLLALVVIFRPSVISVLDFHISTRILPWLAVVVVPAALLLVCLPKLRLKLRGFGQNLLESLRAYAKRPQKLVAALLLAMGVTLTYTLILYVCMRSLGLSLSYLNCFIIFSIGMLVGTATPTPGGLVGAEAGLFAGFAAYGVPAEQALAAALLFRLISYWIPMIPGLGALIIARRHQLL